MFPSNWTLALLGNSMLCTAIVPYWENQNFFPLACLPSMRNVVILSTHAWMGVQHSLIHREISISSAVLPVGRCGFHCFATQERVSIFCGLWTLEIQHYCPNKTKCSFWNCVVVLNFCWYENMCRIIGTSFWGYQYRLNYHSFSQKGYYFTYQRNTHTSLLTGKKTLELQNSYEV